MVRCDGISAAHKVVKSSTPPPRYSVISFKEFTKDAHSSVAAETLADEMTQSEGREGRDVLHGGSANGRRKVEALLQTYYKSSI